MKKIFSIIAVLTVSACINAQTTKESPWKEVQTVTIPFGETVFTSTTKNGNLKAWFEFGDLKVAVSYSNAAKYNKQEVELLLVKWQNRIDTTKVKYTTRQKINTNKKATPNIDITKLF